ncbi:SGNH/GDSL hydrolase family protein [uncultured Cellulomonas sp.]|uniref:SGNH/GDSL hydrolase family protein n=1 Tax=uncultured Cellulomonas sp. TaxID=189682 RepID=UPI00261818D8|nr:SGNH/GDSL hydrolase family protein [uncultured Cellulomonas sp.]
MVTTPVRRRRLVPVVVGAAVAAGLGLGAAALAGRPDGAADERTAAAPAEPTGPTGPAGAQPPDLAADAPRIAFLGDSLTVGVGAPPGRGYAPQTARALGWPIAVVDGVSGSGFVAPGLGRPMPDRVPAVVAAKPDVVVVAGGSNDVFGGYDAEAVGAATTELLTELRAGLPDAAVVVLGPFPTSLAGVGAPDPVRDAVREATLAAEARWLDAGAVVASVVTTDADWDRYTSADGLHPNEDGYRAMAHALAAELTELVGAAR